MFLFKRTFRDGLYGTSPQFLSYLFQRTFLLTVATAYLQRVNVSYQSKINLHSDLPSLYSYGAWSPLLWALIRIPGKMTIKDGINSLLYYTNGLIHIAMTALLEDGVHEDATRWARRRMETMKVPRSLFAVTIHTYGLDGLYYLCLCHNTIILSKFVCNITEGCLESIFIICYNGILCWQQKHSG